MYGDKRDYKKIDIYINKKYVCSTNWANTCKKAVKEWTTKNGIKRSDTITACYSKN